MKKHHLLFATCLISSLFVTSIVLLPNHVMASEMWQKTYGGLNDERAYSLIQTSDGGYALLGFTYYIELENQDFYLIKTDEQGNLEWDQTYGGTGNEVGHSLVQASDGGYALAGTTTSFGAGNLDFWLVKTDAEGNMMWNQTYGGEDWDIPYSLIQTSDGGYALAGDTESFGAGEDDYWLVKTDSTGNVEWNQTYGGTGYDAATSVIQTSDGGYVLVGSSSSVENGAVWMVKTDADGNMIWNKQPSPDHIQLSDATSVIETSDGGYALSGDFWVIKTDANGDILFYQSYEAETGWHSASYGLIQASNGDYVLAGYISPVDGGVASDVLLVKTDHEIPIIWNVTRTPSGDIENSTYTNLIKVNVYDVYGLEKVILSYVVDDGSWSNLTMTNTEDNVYSAEIPAYPEATDVFWTIIAENNIGKSSRIDNEFYIVIPEFHSTIILLTSIVLLIPAVVLAKRKISSVKKNNNRIN